MNYSVISSNELSKICADSKDSAPWREFVRRSQRMIAAVAVRTARSWCEPSPQLLDDLVQEVYFKLCEDNCRVLKEFVPMREDAIYGYLKVITGNVVHDHFKGRHAQKRGAGKTDESLEVAEIHAKSDLPGSLEPSDWAILLSQIDAVLQRELEPKSRDRDRKVFWLYYRSGLTASSIASLPGIGLSTKGVESLLLRVTRAVRLALVRDRKGRPEAGGSKGLPTVESL